MSVGWKVGPVCLVNSGEQSTTNHASIELTLIGKFLAVSTFIIPHNWGLQAVNKISNYHYIQNCSNVSFGDVCLKMANGVNSYLGKSTMVGKNIA